MLSYWTNRIQDRTMYIIAYTVLWTSIFIRCWLPRLLSNRTSLFILYSADKELRSLCITVATA